MARVSVVIPLYNKADCIQAAVRSVLNQSFRDLELIVVDDGSTDGGWAALADVPDRRLSLLTQPNAGPGAARNNGLRVAVGEYVAFLDADDEWEPGFLAHAVASLDAHPDCAAFVSGFFIGPERVSRAPHNRRLGLRAGAWRLHRGTSPKTIKQLVDFCHSSCILARRTLVLRYGGYYDAERCTYGEDSYLWLMFLVNHALCVDPEPWVWFHTEHSNLGAAMTGRHPLRPALIAPSPLMEKCDPEYLPELHDLLAYYRLIETEKLLQQGRLTTAELQRWRKRFPWHRRPPVRVALREWFVSGETMARGLRRALSQVIDRRHRTRS